MSGEIPQEFSALFEENERTKPDQDERKFAEIGALHCESGGFLPSVTVAYETWGELSPDRDNAIFVCHALSGDAHAIGWWDRIVGPGKAIDTNRYFVIGSNVLGGCQGTTGPASLADDGKPYQARFPIVTIGDMVEVQGRLVSALGIEKLLAVAGGSMGGMQAIEWTARFPSRVRKAFLTATCLAHSPMQIGFNETARQAVMRDPAWNGGFYEGTGPAGGLAVARMLGHISYLSAASFEYKFSRRYQGKSSPDYHLGVEFEVESYLKHQGDKFTGRFDANSLLYLTRACDYFDRSDLTGVQAEYLVTSFSSDWIYPTAQSTQIEEAARRSGVSVTRHEIDLPWGHDSFLLDGEHQAELLTKFLAE